MKLVALHLKLRVPYFYPNLASIQYQKVGNSFICRLIWSAREMDETVRAGTGAEVGAAGKTAGSKAAADRRLSGICGVRCGCCAVALLVAGICVECVR